MASNDDGVKSIDTYSTIFKIGNKYFEAVASIDNNISGDRTLDDIDRISDVTTIIKNGSRDTTIEDPSKKNYLGLAWTSNAVIIADSDNLGNSLSTPPVNGSGGVFCLNMAYDKGFEIASSIMFNVPQQV